MQYGLSHAPFLPRLVHGNNNIQYGLHTLPPCHHLLILAVNPAQRVITDRGAGGEHEKNIPTNSGKKTLLKSSLTCSTSSIQKSLADFGTQLPKCGSTNERMAGLDGHNVTKMLLKLQILPFPYLKV